MTAPRSERKSTAHAVQLGSACFLAYMCCYLGRNMLSAMMPQLLESGAFDELSLGNMSGAFLITYGVGQLINGRIGDLVPGKYMLPVGLLCPGLLLLLFPYCSSPWWGCLLWGACGFFSSMLWGPISRMIGENTAPKVGMLLLSLMTAASMLGTLLAQGMAVLGGVTDDHRAVFLLCGGVTVGTAVLLFAWFWSMERRGVLQRGRGRGSEENRPIPVPSWRSFRPALLCMLIATMLNGILRNTVTLWIPTFLMQYFGYSVEVSSALTMLLPLFNLGGTFVSLWLYRRLGGSELTHCIWLSLASVPLLGVLLWAGEGRAALPAVISLFLASALTMGVCNLIYSVYLLRFRDSGRLSGLSGLFGFASYILASVASPIFSGLMLGDGPGVLILSWCLVALAAAGASLMAKFFEKKDSCHSAKQEELS